MFPEGTMIGDMDPGKKVTLVDVVFINLRRLVLGPPGPGGGPMEVSAMKTPFPVAKMPCGKSKVARCAGTISLEPAPPW
jgi:hypothetical protein